MLIDSLIELEEIELHADEQTKFDVVVALPSGNLITDWTSFLLTVREDPEWPRPKGILPQADPLGETPQWASVLTAIGTALNPTTVRFTFIAPSNAGNMRYAIDAWGIGGAAGNVAILPSTMVTVLARTR